ncbi:hypothetical protein NHX12_012234 [Muraenolepis orangiensis]|uniref:Uncharacterized protein n=1 Tax=Muraenolepis orangiensis TaxID=630683 RepID=A0A9Q0DDS1_9TELE|nr:hypothetical protein NHX12_012234 [Muraenolepis orangiensis]
MSAKRPTTIPLEGPLSSVEYLQSISSVIARKTLLMLPPGDPLWYLYFLLCGTSTSSSGYLYFLLRVPLLPPLWYLYFLLCGTCTSSSVVPLLPPLWYLYFLLCGTCTSSSVVPLLPPLWYIISFFRPDSGGRLLSSRGRPVEIHWLSGNQTVLKSSENQVMSG